MDRIGIDRIFLKGSGKYTTRSVKKADNGRFYIILNGNLIEVERINKNTWKTVIEY